MDITDLIAEGGREGGREGVFSLSTSAHVGPAFW